MGFDAADDPLVAIIVFREGQTFGAAKAEFFRDLVKQIGKLRCRRSQATGVLFGGEDGDVESLGCLDERAATADQFVRDGNGGKQFFLDVDDEQPRSGSRKQFGTAGIRDFGHERAGPVDGERMRMLR